MGFSAGSFSGASYTGSLPNDEIKYGTWEINKRNENNLIVKIYSTHKSTVWMNSYIENGWSGWEKTVVNSDIANEIPYSTDIVNTNISNTYNPMSIAENMLNENKLRTKYIRVGDSTGYENYAPVPYSVYEIRQALDTISINTINYQDGYFYTNSRSKTKGWTGWKKATMTTV